MKIRHLCATSLAAFVLLGCANPNSAGDRLRMQQLADSINARLDAANRGDREAAMDVCIDAFNLQNKNRHIRDNVNLAWYWCSNLAKENNAQAQYLSAWLLNWRDFDYSAQVMNAPGSKPGDVYLEALYWYRMAIKNGHAKAEPDYQELLKFYNSEYGSGRSDLFGKIVAGAFIGGVAKSAGASNALTANAVGAFAADAATNGQAHASASFLRNAGPSQLPPPLKRETSKAAQDLTVTSVSAPSSPTDKKPVASSETANAAPERYICEKHESLTTIKTSKLTADQACQSADRKAFGFVSGFGKDTIVGKDTRKLLSIESCRMVNDTAVVRVSYSEVDLNPCGSSGKGMSR